MVGISAGIAVMAAAASATAAEADSSGGILRRRTQQQLGGVGSIGGVGRELDGGGGGGSGHSVAVDAVRAEREYEGGKPAPERLGHLLAIESGRSFGRRLQRRGHQSHPTDAGLDPGQHQRRTVAPGRHRRRRSRDARSGQRDPPRTLRSRIHRRSYHQGHRTRRSEVRVQSYQPYQLCLYIYSIFQFIHNNYQLVTCFQNYDLFHYSSNDKSYQYLQLYL